MTLEKGARVRRDGTETYIQAFIRVQPGARGVRFKRFALTSTRQARQAWRTEQLGTFGPRPAVGGSFADKVREYLQQNRSKRSINQAAAHLELWLQALGRDRDPLTILKEEINAMIDRWLSPPPQDPASAIGQKGTRGRPALSHGLKPGTVRKRRMWLRQFFVFLTGVDGGPCQKATNPKPPKAGPRGIDYVTIEKAMASMPVRRSAKKGTVGALSLSLIRARVMMYTGLPPQLLMSVVADDLNFPAAKLYVRGRDKGDGVEERELSLNPDALAAFKDFHLANAYGPFSVSSMGRSVKAAFRRVGYLRHVKLYDLRHSYLTQLYRMTRDLATVSRLGMHAEGSPMTARYAKGANQEVDEAAVAAFSQQLAARRQGALKIVAKVEPKESRKVARKVARIR